MDSAHAEIEGIEKAAKHQQKEPPRTPIKKLSRHFFNNRQPVWKQIRLQRLKEFAEPWILLEILCRKESVALTKLWIDHS